MNIGTCILSICLVLVSIQGQQNYEVKVDVRTLAKVVQEVEDLKKSNEHLKSEIQELKSKIFQEKPIQPTVLATGMVIPIVLSTSEIANQHGQIDFDKKQQIVDKIINEFAHTQVIEWNTISPTLQTSILQMISGSLKNQLQSKTFWFSQMSVITNHKTYEKIPTGVWLYTKHQTSEGAHNLTILRRQFGRNYELTDYSRILEFNEETDEIVLENTIFAKKLEYDQEIKYHYITLHYQDLKTQQEQTVFNIFNNNRFPVIDYQVHPQSIILLRVTKDTQKIHKSFTTISHFTIGPSFFYPENIYQDYSQNREIYFCTYSDTVRFDSIEYPCEFYVDEQKISAVLIKKLGGTACYRATIPTKGKFFSLYMGYRYLKIPYSRLHSGIAFEKPYEVSIKKLMDHLQNIEKKHGEKRFIDTLERFGQSSKYTRLQECSVAEKNEFLKYIIEKKSNYPKQTKAFEKILQNVQKIFLPGEKK